MKYLTITAIIVFAFGTLMFIVDQRGYGDLGWRPNLGSGNWLGPRPTKNKPAKEEHRFPTIRANGKIEGRTELIEMRSRIAEQIREVHVVKGSWVSPGDLLISLDADNLVQERDLAAALLEQAESRKKRLEKGARSSEIEAAKKDYEANLAPLWGAERALQRGLKLLEDNAIGQQDVDDLQANAESLARPLRRRWPGSRQLNFPPTLTIWLQPRPKFKLLSRV